MKKTLFSIITILAVMLSTVQPVMAEHVLYETHDAQKNFDAYSETIATECYEWFDGAYSASSTNNFKIDPKGGFGSIKNYRYIRYKDMNFGTNNAVTVKIKYAHKTAKNGTMQFIKNPTFDKNGNVTGGTILASIAGNKLSTTGNYYNWKETEPFELTNPEEAVGIFDLYIRFTGDFYNFYAFEFEWQYENIDGPNVIMKDSGGSATTDVLSASTISADATVQKNTDEGQTTGAILLAEYADDGAMLNLKYDEQVILNSNGITDFAITQYSKNSGTVGLGAYFWKDDLTHIKGGTQMGTVNMGTGDASAADISATVLSGTVTISGSGVTDDSLSVVVVPAGYNKNQAAYKSAVQLCELAVNEGTYCYSFKMEENVPTGDYIAIVKGDNTSLEKTFAYTNPMDIYNALVALSNAADTDVAGLLKTNAGMLGIDAVLFNNVALTDATMINAKLKEVFNANPLDPTAGDYTDTINAIKTAILPQSVVAAIKNGNASNAAKLIEEYAAELGVKSTNKYKKYFADNKEYIGKAIMDNITADLKAENFGTLFDTAVIVGVFNAASSWGYVDSAILDFDGELGITTSSYRRLKNEVKQQMCNTFLNAGFKFISEIVDKFNGLISQYATDENMSESSYDLMQSQVGEDIFYVKVSHEIEIVEEPVIKTFKDLDSVEWAKENILSMYNNGYVTGKGEETFAPNDKITREEFAAILVRSFGINKQSADGLAFGDVDKNAWYAGYIAAAKNTGIVNGVNNNAFGVGQPVTREQAAAMLQRAVVAVGKNILPAKSSAAFIDSIQISDYAYDAVIELAKAGVVSGVGSDTFLPRNNATRAEAVVMISRLLANIR